MGASNGLCWARCRDLAFQHHGVMSLNKPGPYPPPTLAGGLTFSCIMKSWGLTIFSFSFPM